MGSSGTASNGFMIYSAAVVMNRSIWPCRLAQVQSVSSRRVFISKQSNSSARFSCNNLLGMSVFTAIVGIRLSYRDHGRHGNQGWCTVLSRPLHIREHWELVWKFSSLKIKDVTNSVFHNNKSILRQLSILFVFIGSMCGRSTMCTVWRHSSAIVRRHDLCIQLNKAWNVRAACVNFKLASNVLRIKCWYRLYALNFQVTTWQTWQCN